MFGGADGTTGTDTDSTWVFADGAWTFLSPSFAPSARYDAGVASDPTSASVVLFGGFVASGAALEDTWVFVNGTWADLTSEVHTAPSARGAERLVWDSAENFGISLGGQQNGYRYSDTWVFPTTPLLGASLIASATVVDVGQNISWTATTLGSAGTLSYTYTGLPTGCVSTDLATLSCLPTGPGTFVVTVQVSNGLGHQVNASAVALLVNPDPRVSPLSASPSSAPVGGSILLTTTVTGGTLPLAYTYTGLPADCRTANASVLTCTSSLAGCVHRDRPRGGRPGCLGRGYGPDLLHDPRNRRWRRFRWHFLPRLDHSRRGDRSRPAGRSFPCEPTAVSGFRILRCRRNPSSSSTRRRPGNDSTSTLPARGRSLGPTRWDRPVRTRLAWTDPGRDRGGTGTGQSNIANALGRLVESGLVEEQLGHVQGQPRRLKVYQLTSKGQMVYRELRGLPHRGPAE